MDSNHQEHKYKPYCTSQREVDTFPDFYSNILAGRRLVLVRCQAIQRAHWPLFLAGPEIRFYFFLYCSITSNIKFGKDLGFSPTINGLHSPIVCGRPDSRHGINNVVQRKSFIEIFGSIYRVLVSMQNESGMLFRAF